MINDLPEGKTHYYGDSCIPPHVPPTNSTNELPKTGKELHAVLVNADQPSNPSIRKRVEEVIYSYIYEEIDSKEAVNQILDLITNHLLEEVEEHSRLASRLGEVEYVKNLTLDEIKQIINKIKK